MGPARLAALHGVATHHTPPGGAAVPVPESTVLAVLAALGVDPADEAALERAESAARRLLPPTLVLWHPAGDAAGGTAGPDRADTSGILARLPDRTEVRVVLEDGSETDGRPGLPHGVHRLTAEAPDGRSATSVLIVAPDRAPRPPGRSHGFLVQLYSLLSEHSWGMGDLGDLAELAAWAGRSFGTGFIQVNPLHSAVPAGPGGVGDPSPYRPSSRRFPDPVHLRIEDIPEYTRVTGADRERLEELREQAAALRESVLRKGALIDRDAVWALKREALELIARVPLGPGRRAAYADFLAAQGPALDDHTVWNALAEVHGPHWRAWPPELRDPRSAATARARCVLLDRIDFHARAAWLTDCQLAAAHRAALDAGMGIGIVHDLAVGIHPEGADAWAQGPLLAAGMSVGAPPDAFNSRGQDWGLPPWRPDALAARGYAPFRAVLRSLFAHAGAVRIDHVMGLFRLWWVPAGAPPADGTYVRHDAEAMLAVLLLEAHRAGAVVIGEDLGTVEPGVRESLARRGVLGTSVLWFEREWSGSGRPLPPEKWRADCLATATTHDLPPIAARLSGEHVSLRGRLGLLGGPLRQERTAEQADVAEWLRLLGTLGLLPEGTDGEEGRIRAVHRFLLRTPALMTGVWLPDTVGDRRPQNLPGTLDEYPNWRLPLADGDAHPLTLEEVAASPRLHALMRVLTGGAPPAPPGRPVRHPGRAAGSAVRYVGDRGQEEHFARRHRRGRYDADDAAPVVARARPDA